MEGVHNRMGGGDIRPDLGISIEVAHGFLRLIDLKYYLEDRQE